MIALVQAREIESPHVRPAESGQASTLLDCSWRFVIVRGVDTDIEGALIKYFASRGVDADFVRGGEVAEDDLPEGVTLVWAYSMFPRPWSLSTKQGAIDARVAMRMRGLRDSDSISSGLKQLRQLSDLLHALPDSSVI